MDEVKDERLSKYFQRLVDEGLGGPRYKEYEIAPYALIVRARMAPEAWTGVFYSWLSMKGHCRACTASTARRCSPRGRKRP